MENFNDYVIISSSLVFPWEQCETDENFERLQVVI